ncbi:MAG TPA: hypothetical protein VFI66_00540 [Gemmatimonadales bacterium]|nr:hypothetical protein [Gemmatimonadales bacterium]
MRKWLLGLVAPLLAGGCYVRSPLSTPAPAPGSTVRVTLRMDPTTRLADLLGPNATAVDGLVLASSPDTLLLGVRQVLRHDERAESWQGEHVALERSWVASVDGRHLSVARTALLATGFVAAVIIIGKSISTNLPNPNRCTVNC